MNQIVKAILVEAYEKAEPPLDFNKVLETPEEYPNYYLEHTLPADELNAIIEKHIEEYDLTDDEQFGVYWQACLNYGPATPKS